VIERDAYDGFDAVNALWHSSGGRGDPSASIPVGTLLMIILDHFVFGLGCGRGELEDRLREQERDMLI